MPDPLVPIGPFQAAPFDPEPEREKVRGRITLATTLVFGAILVIYLLAALLCSDARWMRIKEAMEAVLPAVTSILGTVVGFYFGSQKR